MVEDLTHHRMVDLFCGIGGFRLAFDAAGCRCVASYDVDKFAAQTYEANHGDAVILGDFREVPSDDVPDFDVLAAGFPCPSFSRSGVSKRRSMGRKDGFEGESGDLFFEIVRLLRDKRPAAALLENVKHLIHHGKPRGSTFATVLDHLHDAGYRTSWVLTDAVRVVPQMRWRVFISCLRDDIDVEFDLTGVEIQDLKPRLRDILEPDPDPSLILSDHYWNYMQEYREKHRSRGSNFGYHIPDLDGPSRALMARYYKDGSEILIDRGPGLNPRKLSVREAARLMGYPDDFEFPVSKTQAYKQLGNSVVVPLVTPMAKALIDAIRGVPTVGVGPSPGGTSVAPPEDLVREIFDPGQ